MNGVYGKAGTGLQDTSWAVNADVARAGAVAEERMQGLLDSFRQQAAVFHDLRIPIKGFRANIDHVIVSGRHVLVIDTKNWQPGFYWSLGGVNRRGLTRVKHTEKDQAWVQRALTSFLAGTGATVHTPLVAVFPSRAGRANTTFMRVPGATVVPAETITHRVERFIGVKPSDDAITRKLTTLVTKAPLRPVAGMEHGF